VLPQESPPPRTHCIVDHCLRPATTYVDVAASDVMEGLRAVPMCDPHAAHWQHGG
jgi:hypothetical protein